MPRNPPRKTNRGTFSGDVMKRAVEAVLNGRSVRSVAKESGLSFQTLARYVKKTKENGNELIRYTPNYAVNKIFSEEQETTLANYLIKCSRMFYGLPLIDCRKLAYEMATINKLKIPVTWEVNKTAGKEWMMNFMRRNPNISLRTPEGCSLARATSFNQHNVNNFFDNLHKVISRQEKFADGTRIYNLDETATVTVQKSAKVLAEKGTKQVSKVTSGEKGVLVTTCVIISASGNYLPPAMVFPRVHFKEHMISGAPTGTLGLAAASGWMNSTLFLQVMKHFIHHTCSSKDNPTLLLYDNHESHLSMDVLNLAKESGVTIVTFPPHSTNKLQPLDVGVFKPFSLAYNAAVDNWLMHHPGKPLSIYEVAACVGDAFQKSMLPGTITSAFRKCGIFPFDRSIFTDVDFLPSSVTDRPISDVKVVDSSPPREQENLENGSGSDQFISPEHFRGFPKAEARKENRQGRKKGRSMIPTDTPDKGELEERHSNRKKPQQQKKDSVKRKINDSDDEEEEEEWQSDGSSDYSIEMEVDPMNFKELERNPVVGDYVLVEFKTEQQKSKIIYYVGKLLSLTADTDEFRISFLRRSEKVQNKFYFPPVPDTSHISKNDIRMILPPPRNYGQTKRQNSYFSFEINFTLIDVR